VILNEISEKEGVLWKTNGGHGTIGGQGTRGDQIRIHPPKWLILRNWLNFYIIQKMY
jgi:hypothetical protein